MTHTDYPTLIVRQDYDGYFEGLVNSWLEHKRHSGVPFNHVEVVISAGPYRPYAVSYEKDGGSIHLDFYSALRTGFGSLGNDEVEAIIELL